LCPLTPIFITPLSLPVSEKVELGAGTGDWVASQASADGPSGNWLSVELRFDRVATAFAKVSRPFGSLF